MPVEHYVITVCSFVSQRTVKLRNTFIFHCQIKERNSFTHRLNVGHYMTHHDNKQFRVHTNKMSSRIIPALTRKYFALL